MLRGCLHGGWCVQVLAVPELEDEQLPQPQRVIAASGQVLVDDPVDERRFEVAALPRSRRLQHVREHLGQSAAEPDAERNAESLFLPIRMPAGSSDRSRLLQDVLAAAIPES